MVNRNSTIELLRIICIVIIIITHFCGHGILSQIIITRENYSWQLFVTQLLAAWGPMANMVFILITGYFMINREMHYKKLFLLIIAMFFYAWVIAAVFYGFHLEPATFNKIFMAAIPVWTGYNWFVCCYIILFILMPFLNLFLNKLSQRQYIKLVLLTLFLFGIAPTFAGKTYMNDYLIIFILMYAVGGYISLYGLKNNSHHFWSWAAICCFIISLASIVCLNVTGYILGINTLIVKCQHFIPMLSIFISVSLFMSFLTMKPFVSTFINRIAGSVLGIYLIHDNPIIRQFVWTDFLPNTDYVNSDRFLAFMVLKVAAVFIICLFIDQLRIYFMEKPLKKYIDKHWENWNEIKLNINDWGNKKFKQYFETKA